MSVLAEKRKIAFTEFEMQCSRCVEQTEQRCSSIPVRSKKFIKPKLMYHVVAAYHAAIMANEHEWKTETGKAERVKLMDEAIKQLLLMQKPLVVYWSLFDTKDGGIEDWKGNINKAIVLLNAAAGFHDGERELPMIRSFKLKYSEDAIFVSKVRAFHKFTYQKLYRVPEEYKNRLTDEISSFADNVLYSVLRGNEGIPENAKQYKTRDGYFRKAIDNLNGMQRPLYALWNIMEYDENTMDEWASLMNECIKMIQGVRKSDRERFGKLK